MHHGVCNASLDAINNTHMPNQVSFGDVIQFGAALGLTLCPGGPVVPFFTGRTNATAAAPPNLVPLPDQDVTTLLARMMGKLSQYITRK